MQTFVNDGKRWLRNANELSLRPSCGLSFYRNPHWSDNFVISCLSDAIKLIECQKQPAKDGLPLAGILTALSSLQADDAHVGRHNLSDFSTTVQQESE